MTRITLTQNKYTIVDDNDFTILNKKKWYFSHGYAMRDEKEGRIYLHRFLLNPPKGFHIDHRNRNTLDNRRSNLRVVTRSQNQINRGIPKNNTSGVLGVSWFKRDKKWKVQIKLNNKNRHIGYYNSLEEATRARKEAELRLFKNL